MAGRCNPGACLATTSPSSCAGCGSLPAASCCAPTHGCMLVNKSCLFVYAVARYTAVFSQMAEVLISKLPNVFRPFFLKEGVLHAMEQLAASYAAAQAAAEAAAAAAAAAAAEAAAAKVQSEAQAAAPTAAGTSQADAAADPGRGACHTQLRLFLLALRDGQGPSLGLAGCSCVLGWLFKVIVRVGACAADDIDATCV